MEVEKIMVSQQDSIFFINSKDIIYCQSDNCYTNIFLINGEKLLIVKSLKRFHQELSTRFVRVSQSFIINTLYISRINKKKKVILLNEYKEIPYTITLRELLILIKTDLNQASTYL